MAFVQPLQWCFELQNCCTKQFVWLNATECGVISCGIDCECRFLSKCMFDCNQNTHRRIWSDGVGFSLIAFRRFWRFQRNVKQTLCEYHLTLMGCLGYFECFEQIKTDHLLSERLSGKMEVPNNSQMQIQTNTWVWENLLISTITWTCNTCSIQFNRFFPSFEC